MSPLISIHFLQRQSDDKLVVLARAGNERAFETLVRRYRRPLLAYARRLAGSEVRAEDALQQALLQAWIALCADAKPNDVRPWLFRIVHNVVVSGLRRQQHQCVELDEALDTADRVAGADVRIECREALSGLAALPELQRRAIVLTAFGGNSHGEVAATLGLTNGAVRGLIYRARAALRSAATVLPLPVTRWAANRSTRRTSLLERVGELLGGGGAAGAGGILLKGGATAATLGAVATATQMFVPAVPAQHHVRPRTAPAAGAIRREHASTLPGSFLTASHRVASAHAGTTRSSPTGLRALGSRGARARTVTLAASGTRSGARSGAGDGRSGGGDGRSGGGGGSRSGGGDRSGSSGSGGGDGSGSGSTSGGGGDGSGSGSTSGGGGALATIDGGGGTTVDSKDGGGGSVSSTSATTSGSGDGGSTTTTTGGGGSDGGSGGGGGGGSSDGGGSTDGGGSVTTTGG